MDKMDILNFQTAQTMQSGPPQTATNAQGQNQGGGTSGGAVTSTNSPLSALYNAQPRNIVAGSLCYPEELNSLNDNQFPHCIKISVFKPGKSKYDTNSGVEINPTIGTQAQANFGLGNEIPGFSANTPIAGFLAGRAAAGLIAGLSQNKFNLQGLAGFGAFLAGTTLLEDLIGNTLLQTTNISREANLLQQNIYLYVPEQVVAKHSHKYSDVSATNAYGDLGFLLQAGQDAKGGNAGFTNVTDLFADFRTLYGTATGNGPITREFANRTVGRLTEAFGLTGEGLQQLQLQGAGYALNPQLEVLFDNTDFRTFQFSFSFLPRTVKEAENVTEIIRNLRFYAAPEIAAVAKTTGTSNAPDTTPRYFVPPYYFELEFKKRSDNKSTGGAWEDNPYMPRISTCVLESIDVDYVGDSDRFLTFTDGRPVNMKMILNFKEIEIIHKELILRGY